MARHLLNDRRIRAAKPGAKPYRLADGDGLFLFVPPSGVRAWQFRYRLNGKPLTATLGRAEVLSLREARDAADQARKQVANGQHLTVLKRVEEARTVAQLQNTFAAVAADWVESEARRARWTPGYKAEVARSLANHLADLNALPLAEVSALVAAPILRRMERRAPDMAVKVHRRLRAILDHGVEHGLIGVNPVPARRRGKQVERRHFPAVLERSQVGDILRLAERVDACRGVKRAHALLVFCVQRVGEVVAAEWSEFDLDAGVWSIPRERMKRRDPERGPHLVPLPPHLFERLRDWRRQDGAAKFVCPGPRNQARCVTREAVEKFYRRTLELANKHSPHSWRSVFSTLARDAGRDADAVEAHLDHIVGNKVQAAYDRATRLEIRRDLMAWYEETLIAARDGADVVEITSRRA
jgi:integrase